MLSRVPLNYEADPMGFFHIINAYEESGHLVLDAPFKVVHHYHHHHHPHCYVDEADIVQRVHGGQLGLQARPAEEVHG